MFDEDKQPNEENNNLDESVESGIADEVPQSQNDIIDDNSTEFSETSFDEKVDSEISNHIDEDEPVMVQPVQFASFDEEENIHGTENKNLDLLMNVNLQMSVELGRTELPFKKVLELTRGSIISLNKLAGEPVELYANGKLVAYGEVVVIEDNFGLRVTSIAAAEERLKTVHETKSKE